jgi:hypothetical protein
MTASCVRVNIKHIYLLIYDALVALNANMMSPILVLFKATRDSMRINSAMRLLNLNRSHWIVGMLILKYLTNECSVTRRNSCVTMGMC